MADLQARISGGESSTVEFGRFRSFAEKDWLSTVCAMANTEGGTILLGVRDDGTIDGVPMDPEEVAERLTVALQSGLSAPVPGRIGRELTPGGWVHWIEVRRVRRPEPLRIRGRVLVRRGRSSAEPTTAELQELYSAFGVVITEERIIPGTTSADIEPTAFRRYLARKGIELDDSVAFDLDLRNRDVLAPDFDDTLRATLFGLLCFGREPQGFAPTRGFFVDLVAYAGPDRADPVFSASRAEGRADEQVDRAESWLKSLGHQENYEGTTRVDTYAVPLAAFRECVVNAVAHREYSLVGEPARVEVFSDRVAIWSPGALPNHKRVESVLAGGAPRSRNEAIASFLLDVGKMERRGSGYPRIRREMTAFNGTSPELEENREERWVRVTLRRK